MNIQTRNAHYVVRMSVNLTDADLKRIMDQVMPFVAYFKGIGIIFGDYDLDPRKLWEIPEVQNFCRRLVHLNYLGILKMPERSNATADIEFIHAFGALEVFLISRDIDISNVFLNRKDMDEFLQAARMSQDAVQAA